MRKCPCRTARPSGPSTRRGPTATELPGGLPCWDRPGLPDLPAFTLVLRAEIPWSLFVYIILKGKPKLRTDCNAGPNLWLEWLRFFGKRGTDRWPSSLSKISER